MESNRLNMTLDKWFYIDQIKKLSNLYSDKLIGLMDAYGKINLREITYEEAKEYWININFSNSSK